LALPLQVTKRLCFAMTRGRKMRRTQQGTIVVAESVRFYRRREKSCVELVELAKATALVVRFDVNDGEDDARNPVASNQSSSAQVEASY